MKISTIINGPLEENCYILSKDNNALIIDPGSEAKKIIESLEGLNVKGILVTHHHDDHIGALKELEEYYNLKENTTSYFDYEVIETKGHTSDSKCYYFKEINSIFVGDFIFKDGIGRTDLGGNDKEMKESLINFINRFNKDVVLYPGHGKSTTLGEEIDNIKYMMEVYLWKNLKLHLIQSFLLKTY